jgi:hypothetical protein
MSYIGSQPTTASFPFDQFTGNGSTTSFTLTYAPAGATSIVVAISGVMQNPNNYSVIGTTLTFSPAPPAGVNNISVLYLGLPVIGSTSPGNTAFLSATDITATTGQTVFASAGSYTPGFVQVYRNGARLGAADFTATNGTTITLTNAAVSGDLVTIEYYTLTSLVNALPLTGGTVTGSVTIQGLTVGKGAGSVATNTAVGASALAANTTGGNNTAVGYQAMYSNTTGTQNVAVGKESQKLNTTGFYNNSIGAFSLAANTTGNYNNAMGRQALTANTTGSNNTAIGQEALTSSTTASNNTAVGYQAGLAATTGTYNTAVGSGAGRSSTTSGNNTLIGGDAGAALIGGSNTFIGAGVGQLITTGTKNTIIGGYNGNQGGLDIRTASNNIVLSDGDGNPALWYDGAGTWNNRGTGVGSCGGYNMRDSNYTKYWSMAANSSNWYLFDADSSHYPTFAQNGTAWGFGSDARIKTDVTEINYGLDTVLAIKPKRYKFKASGKIDIGFIAQELREVVPEAVFGNELEFFDTDTPQERAEKTLNVGKEILIPVLVKAIQEQQALIVQLQADVAALKAAA